MLEKAEALGAHCLSGAVVNPRAFRELFPEMKDADFPFRAPVAGERVYFLTGAARFRIPTPPTMQNHGNYVASLCEMVRWLGEKAEALGVNMFTGFPADVAAGARASACAACAPTPTRPQARRLAGQRLRAAHRPHARG